MSGKAVPKKTKAATSGPGGPGKPSKASLQRSAALQAAASTALENKRGRAAKDALFAAAVATVGHGAPAGGPSTETGPAGGAVKDFCRPAVHQRRPYDVEFRQGLEPGVLAGVLREFGVAVVWGVVELPQCAKTLETMVRFEEVVSGGYFHRDFYGTTWKKENIAPMISDGHVQGLGHTLADVNDVRSHPNVTALFSAAYTGLRGAPIAPHELVGGVDGFGLRPPVAPFDTGDERDDRPHMDMSYIGGGEEVVLGEVPVNKDVGCVVYKVSLKSHLLADDLLTEKYQGQEHAGDFTRLPPKWRKAYKASLAAKGGRFQALVYVPPGGLLLRLASTLHSVRAQPLPKRPVPLPSPAAPFPFWHAAVHVCLRPASEGGEDRAPLVHWAYMRGMGTDARGTRVVAPRPATEPCTTYSPSVSYYMAEPWQLFRFFPATLRPEFGQLLGTLTGPVDPTWAPFVFDPALHYVRMQRTRAAKADKAAFKGAAGAGAEACIAGAGVRVRVPPPQ